MDINWNQFYAGTQYLEKADPLEKAEPLKYWKAGKEWKIEEPDYGVKIPEYDKMVKYDFGLTPEGDNITFADLKNLPHEENAIYQISGGRKLKETVNQQIGNKFDRAKPASKEEASAGRVGNKIDKVAVAFQDKVLNHPFVNDAFDLDKLFNKMAVGYAKYLNNDIESEYDDEMFYGFEDEERYRKLVQDDLREAAGDVVSYFMLGQRPKEDIDRVSGQLADAVIKYAHQVAAGNRNLDDLDALITINGVDMQYRELLKVQQTLYQLNKEGVGGREFRYDGFSNYDTTPVEELGKKTREVRRMCKYNLSEEAGSMVVDVYSRRTENQIKLTPAYWEKHYEEFKKLAEESLKKYGNYSNSDVENALKNYRKEIERFHEAYNKYAMAEV